ncbi:MAG: sigma-54-dependent Fis family transcriptional regulator [Desulfotalea sp.]|nr:MAG: sigma-54-dependent Fis family transcriptional regulator [Desulfotalea sp.]
MNQTKQILIVDDDLTLLEVLHTRLTTAGFKVAKASNGKDALVIMQKKSIDLLISDIKMPEMSGMELLTKVRATSPRLPVIFLTAYGTISGAVGAVKAGALDYLTKPFEGKDLITMIHNILGKPTKRSKDLMDTSGFIWGVSQKMEEVKELLKKVAGSNATILILGESGVGKECIAKLLHNFSTRVNGPYMVVDCGSTPPGILESELFGHLKGSFTHAISDKKGLIESANGGTLFLDEVGNISAEMQSRLLRFLEERTIRQVGAVKEKTIDCRVIAATNSDLKQNVEDGTFRQDLYYRLKVVTMLIPPLQERIEDIPELARFFVSNYTSSNNLPAIELPDETIKWLQTLEWPGNVRELKNSLETGSILCKNNIILPEDLQLEAAPNPSHKRDENNFSIEESEKEAIIRALKQTKGVKKEAAELLGISRRAIQYKSKKYELDASEFKK